MKQFDTREFVNSHGKAPRGHGTWIFQNEETGDEHQGFGTYSDIKKLLPGGNWIVLP